MPENLRSELRTLMRAPAGSSPNYFKRLSDFQREWPKEYEEEYKKFSDKRFMIKNLERL